MLTIPRPTVLTVLLLIAQVPQIPAANTPSAGEVVLSTADYQILVAAADAAAAASKVNDKPDPVVSNASFVLSIDGDRATWVETFEIISEGDGWVVLPVVKGGAERVALEPPTNGFWLTDADGIASVALAAAGTWRARIERSQPVVIGADGWQSVDLSMPRFAIHSGRAEIRGDDLEINITAGEKLGEKRAAGVTTVDIAVDCGGSLALSFREKPREKRISEGPLVADGELYLRSAIVGGDLVTDVRARITASSGSISRVAFTVPSAARVLYLRGPGLLDWEIDGTRATAARAVAGPEPQLAELRFTEPLGADTRVTLPVVDLDVPGKVTMFADFRPPSDQLAEAIDNGSFVVVEPGDLPPVFADLVSDAEEVLRLVPGGKSPQPAVYRLHRPAAASVLTAQVRLMSGTTLVAANGRTLSRIRFEVLSSAKSFLILTLPAGSTLWGAEALGKPVVAAAPREGTIAIPLRSARGRMASVVVYLLGQVAVPVEDGEFEVPLPAADIPISRLSWELTLPAGGTYTLVGTAYQEGWATHSSERVGELTAAGDEEVASRDGFTDMIASLLAEDGSSGRRRPIVPRWPVSSSTLLVHADLPNGSPTPIRVGRKVEVVPGEWR